MKTTNIPKGTRNPAKGSPAKMKDPVIVDGIGTMEREQAERLYPNVKHTPTKLYKTNEDLTLVEVSTKMMLSAAKKALSKAKNAHSTGDEVLAAKKAKQSARITTKANNGVVSEGWGAEAQRAEHEKSVKAWEEMLSKHANDSKMTAWLKYFRINNWKASYAETEAKKRVEAGKTVAESVISFKAFTNDKQPTE